MQLIMITPGHSLIDNSNRLDNNNRLNKKAAVQLYLLVKGKAIPVTGREGP
jgi:hypothetical protein